MQLVLFAARPRRSERSKNGLAFPEQLSIPPKHPPTHAKDTFVTSTREILDSKGHKTVVMLVLRNSNPSPNLKGENSPSLAIMVIAHGN